MDARFAPLTEDNPNLDDCFQGSSNRCPQTSEQKNSDADRDEVSSMEPRMGHSPKFGCAPKHQGNGCGYALGAGVQPQANGPETWKINVAH